MGGKEKEWCERKKKQLTDSGTRPEGIRKCLKLRTGRERRYSRKTNLYAPRGHIQLHCQLVAKSGIRFCVAFEDVLKDLELCTCGALPVLDFVWGIWIKSAKVDWIHGAEGWMGSIKGRIFNAHRKALCVVWKVEMVGGRKGGERIGRTRVGTEEGRAGKHRLWD